jgi:hypothetical protein
MFNHEKEDLYDAIGIERERAEEIANVVMSAVRNSDKNSEMYEKIYLADLNNLECIVAGSLITQMKRQMFMQSMVGGLFSMLSDREPHMCTKCGKCGKTFDEDDGPELNEDEKRRLNDIIKNIKDGENEK